MTVQFSAARVCFWEWGLLTSRYVCGYICDEWRRFRIFHATTTSHRENGVLYDSSTDEPADPHVAVVRTDLQSQYSFCSLQLAPPCSGVLHTRHGQAPKRNREESGGESGETVCGCGAVGDCGRGLWVVAVIVVDGCGCGRGCGRGCGWLRLLASVWVRTRGVSCGATHEHAAEGVVVRCMVV